MLFSILLLSISLSIDALGIGITYGLRGIHLSAFSRIIISLQSIFITSLSLYCGKWMTKLFSPSLSVHIGISILILMGIWILWQGIRENDEEEIEKKEETILDILIKSMGITIKIIRTPQYCDLNHSFLIDPFEALYLGFALSIDSFGVGLGSGASGLFSPAIPFLVAVCQVLFLSLGGFFGSRLKMFSNIKNNVWVILSGILLILIGILRMF